MRKEGVDFVGNLRKKLGVDTNEELAVLLGVTVSCINGWHYQNTRPGRLVQRIIDNLLKQGGK